MTTRTRVPSLFWLSLTTLLALAALTGCGRGYYGGGVYGGGYYGHHGYYGRSYGGGGSSSYGRTGIVYNTPTRGVVVSAPLLNEPVTGSDASFGWRNPTSNPDNELRRLTESMVRAGCTVKSSNTTESHGQCFGAETMVRIDASNSYKLCVAGTDQNLCANTWARIGP